MIERGRAPTLWEIVEDTEAAVPSVLQSLGRLEANHGYVPHPGTVDAWVVHPFSTTPTGTYVSSDERGWWAPCMWCGLGIASLVDTPTTIRTSLGGVGTPIEIAVIDGVVDQPDLVAHFPIPLSQAWANVHAFCASVQVFTDDNSAGDWAECHGIRRGESVALHQLSDLAQAWYGGHLDLDWVKPTVSEAKAVFDSVGLTAPHWQIPAGDERF